MNNHTEVTEAAPGNLGDMDNMAGVGIIEVICGCMFSGKTTKLLELLRAEPPEGVLIVKHSKDRRYSTSRILTHNGDGCPAVVAGKSSDIPQLVKDFTNIVAIDEGHFYDSGITDVCQELAHQGKRVIVTALDLDMWGEPFATVEQLKELAGTVRVQRATCAACGKPATHTHRKTPIVNRNLVGGPEDFEPRCRKCWTPPPEEHIGSAEMA